jgi:hypothetical protein
VEADVSEKTIRRYLDARPIRPLSLLRIERAGRMLGLLPHTPTNANAPGQGGASQEDADAVVAIRNEW